MKKYIILAFVSLALVSCEETVQLNLNNAEPIVIIEGLVTNQMKFHSIRVTRSTNFYDNTGVNAVNNATVSVSDGDQTFNYLYAAGENGEGGKYFSEVEFAGQVGKAYSMNVSVDGQLFTATDVLYPVTNIDSLTVKLNQAEFENPEEGREEYYYEVLFYAHEPQETKDFYLFKYYRNDTLIFDDETDIYFANDKGIEEDINGIPTASFYKLGDVGKVEMYSISNNGFIYYNDLINLLKSDGGMFGSPPVNPRTNIKGGALGFFQTSSMVSDTVTVR